MTMAFKESIKNSILRVGEVSEVNGRQVTIKVDENKNLSSLFFDGDTLTNVSVNSFVEIRKGFLSIIGKVDGEKIEEDIRGGQRSDRNRVNKSSRLLMISLSGYIDHTGKFVAGLREFPLIGNEAFVVTKDQVQAIHNLTSKGGMSINIASTEDGIDIEMPVDRLFNTHIAIFGNTGSGKSNTLTHLYQDFFKTLKECNPDKCKSNAHFLLFDFNGEYASDECITQDKTVYSLSARKKKDQLPSGEYSQKQKDRFPIGESALLNPELLFVLSQATEATQKPFLKRALALLEKTQKTSNPEAYFNGILKKQAEKILLMSDKNRSYLLLDYMEEILKKEGEKKEGEKSEIDIRSDLEWHNNNWKKKKPEGGYTFIDLPEHTNGVKLMGAVEECSLPKGSVQKIITFSYVQLIEDVLSNRAQNEHIAPVINRLKSRKKDIEKLFDVQEEDCSPFEESSFIVINLDDVNLDMKKVIPLLVSKYIYSKHKEEENKKSLNLIIDEAHNILSKDSFREAESWKDYRLETFEEIIKEGRKFGVFLTISSQRPNDISETIISQAHNYFIHRLVNQKDLLTIGNAVSYIDKPTEDSIPTLPTGVCIFSGVAGHMPLKLKVKPLPQTHQPKSNTLEFAEIVKDEKSC